MDDFLKEYYKNEKAWENVVLAGVSASMPSDAKPAPEAFINAVFDAQRYFNSKTFPKRNDYGKYRKMKAEYIKAEKAGFSHEKFNDMRDRSLFYYMKALAKHWSETGEQNSTFALLAMISPYQSIPDKYLSEYLGSMEKENIEFALFEYSKIFYSKISQKSYLSYLGGAGIGCLGFAD